MIPSKKARIVAMCAAALSFVGTLAVFARADEPAPKKFVVVAIPENCIDYHVGQIVYMPATTPDEVVVIDRGGSNDGIYVAPEEPEDE